MLCNAILHRKEIEVTQLRKKEAIQPLSVDDIMVIYNSKAINWKSVVTSKGAKRKKKPEYKKHKIYFDTYTSRYKYTYTQSNHFIMAMTN